MLQFTELDTSLLDYELLVASLLLVAMPFVPSSFLLLVVRPGAPSSVLAPSRFCARSKSG